MQVIFELKLCTSKDIVQTMRKNWLAHLPKLWELDGEKDHSGLCVEDVESQLIGLQILNTKLQKVTQGKHPSVFSFSEVSFINDKQYTNLLHVFFTNNLELIFKLC